MNYKNIKTMGCSTISLDDKVQAKLLERAMGGSSKRRTISSSEREAKRELLKKEFDNRRPNHDDIDRDLHACSRRATGRAALYKKLEKRRLSMDSGCTSAEAGECMMSRRHTTTGSDSQDSLNQKLDQKRPNRRATISNDCMKEQVQRELSSAGNNVPSFKSGRSPRTSKRDQLKAKLERRRLSISEESINENSDA